MQKLLFKLSHDALALLLLPLGALLVAAVVFPGFLTRFVTFDAVVLALTLTLLLMTATAARAPEHRAQERCARRALVSWTLLALPLVLLADRAFALWQSAIITGLLLATLAALCAHRHPTKSA